LFALRFQFPKANIQTILDKVRNKLGGNMEDVRSFFTTSDPSGAGIVDYEAFRQLLQRVRPAFS
jgi:hypothetical protein